MESKELIQSFYESFARLDAEEMIACYHDEIEFTDPAFGLLKSKDAKNMWRMLVERGKDSLKIEFDNVRGDSEKGSADWIATYQFSQTGRNVINHIHARFEFRDGKIIRHVDDFDLWKWSRQALGLSGYLLGWSSFMGAKIRERSNAALREFTAKRNL